MSATEINNPAVYEVTSLKHEMGKASRMVFYVIADKGDSTAIADRTEVKFTIGSTCVFYGRTLPAKRVIRNGVDTIEYTAADPIEFLGNNPVANSGDGVNWWYNRKDIDISAYVYPTAQRVRDIVDTEFASIVGTGQVIYAIDWTEGGNPANVVPFTFQVKGKSWLGLLEALINETPGLTYWYDPTTYNEASNRKGTLRFYDLTAAGSSPKQVILPYRDPLSPRTYTANWEAGEIVEDVSASYDTVVVHGWGTMTEVYESATADWTALSSGAIGGSMPFLRKTAAGSIEAFVPGLGGGTWTDESLISPRPWFPESNAPGYKAAYRRFSVPDDVADIKIVRANTGSPAEYRRELQSVWLDVCQNVWDLGSSWTVSGQVHSVVMAAGIRIADFGDTATVDNDGIVKANPTLYPTYPTIGANETKFALAVPSAIERDRFIVKEPMVRRTDYLFTSILTFTGSSGYANLANQVCFKYWPIDFGMKLRYTKHADFSVTQTDGALGYDKRLDLYDERFLKYIDKDGNTLRDDTTYLNAYLTPVWDLVKRKRVYGSLVIHDEGGGNPFTLWPMGTGITLCNYGSDNTTRTLPVRVQSVDITQWLTQQRVTIAFDRENTFRPLSKYLEGHEWFIGNSAAGEGGLEGKRGDKLVVEKQKVKRPFDASLPPEAMHNQTVSGTPNTSDLVFVRGIITERSIAVGLATSDTGNPSCVKYRAKTADNAYDTGATQQVPILRQFRDRTTLKAAEIDSHCIIGLIPSNTGTIVPTIYLVSESLAQWLIAGHITAVTTTASAKPPAISYKYTSDDGLYSATVFEAPQFRPYNNNPLVVPAAVGTRCQIQISLDSAGVWTAYLWSVQEQIDFAQCSTGDSGYQYSSNASLFDPAFLIVNSSGQEIVNDEGNLILSASSSYTNEPESQVITNEAGFIIFDKTGANPILADQSVDLIADPAYFDTLFLSNTTGTVIVGHTTSALLASAAADTGGDNEAA